MPRILIVSDSPAIQSGLARVTRELAARFADEGHEVAVAGWFDIHAAPDAEFDYPVYPAIKRAPEALASLLETIQPHVVLAIGDPWDFEWLARQRARGAPWKLMGYLNIEGRPLPLACESILDGFDVLTTTSEFGAAVIGRKGVRAVHHGVDAATFRPLLRATRAQFVGRNLDETFFVLLNGQNTARKNFPAALEGFALFAKGKEDVLLYANTAVSPAQEDMAGQDLRQTIVNLGLGDDPRILFNPKNDGPLKTVSDEQVNHIYNMATVLLVTSWGEGFCLPVLEAQAVGVVPVAPNDYSMPELIEERGFLYPVATRLENLYGMRVAIVGAMDVAAALQEAYEVWRNHPETWRKRKAACMAFAREKPWDATYAGITAAMQAYAPGKVATGGRISAQLRLDSRAAAKRHPEAFGVLKLGGLGDLLQASAVIAAIAEKTGKQAVVFTNQPAPVFEENPHVAEVVAIASQPQQTALESLGDAFESFYDLRYVSRAYGKAETAPFGDQHRWFYDDWTRSSSRLHTLGMHSTRVMLHSLGYPDADGRPRYFPRQKVKGLPDAFIVVAGGVGVMGGLKAWPAEAWERFMSLVPIAKVQIGGKDDEDLHATYDFRGASLPETAWIIEQTRMVVAVEGGMVHLAAATNTPATVIFGPTPVESFLYPGHRAVQSPRCTPCFGAEPNWSQGVCAVGDVACRNFPSPEVVFEKIRGVCARD
jgi:glycosyltransferase involved in cell wall biosynthesis/ADP-heptose:LPS heptosyltransferase